MDTSATPLYRLLDIPEVLGKIMQYFGRGTLSRTARVCTHFHEASIQLLWSGLTLQTNEEQADKYVNLLKHLREIAPSKPDDWKAIDLESNIWDRLTHYSVYVKAIQIAQDAYWDELFSIPMDLRARLFPGLRRLSVTWRTAVDQPGLQWLSFAGPQLKGLQILGRASITDCAPVLVLICRHISTQIPNLEELSLDNVATDPAMKEMPHAQVDAVRASIQPLNRLRSFTWQSSAPLPQEILQVLPTLPNLSSLSLYLPKPLQPRMELESRFPSLRRLKLTALSVKTDPWLQALSNPSLLTHLHIDSAPSSFHTHNLVHIKLADYGIPWSKLAQLLPCKFIRTCKISSIGYMGGLEDSSIRTLAASWQDLEELEIRHAIDQASLTMLCFAALATSCLRLRRLSLHVTMYLVGEYGDAWQQEYRKVLKGSYPAGKLEALCLTVYPPDTHREFIDGGLGTLGVARLIRRLWPSFDPSGLKQKFYDEPISWQTAQAAMAAMILDDGELNRVLAEKESLQKERDQLLEANACLRLEASRLGA